MSVEIVTSTQSMSKSLNSLEITPLTMHRMYFEVSNSDTWYKIMREARTLFGKNWSTQSHVKRKLTRWNAKPIIVWFETPDPAFASWIAVKLAVRATSAPNK